MRRGMSAAFIICVACSALPGTTSAARAQAQDTSSESDIDPDAIAALNKMGAYLRTLTAFQVTAEVLTEDVLLDGQKIQRGNSVNLVAQRPNRLRVDLTSDLQNRLFVFDGKTFAMWAPRMKFYAVAPAPATIIELVDRLEDQYDIELPLADLFRWGGPGSRIGDITAAADIGPREIGGVSCEQYAFRQNGLDWQIWIQQGDYPLPRKLVLTTLTDDARPQHMSTYTWNLAPSYDDAAFVFTPPSDATKIPFATVFAARSISKKGGGR